jgi:hypothetical protein
MLFEIEDTVNALVELVKKEKLNILALNVLQ